jgi:hypothetical protein
MIKWDLKARSCCFYHVYGVDNCVGMKASYSGPDATENEEVETISKRFLGFVLKNGRTRAEQVDEKILEVHRQLLKNALIFWGAPIV